MPQAKYELIEDDFIINYRGERLSRIRALRDFGAVKAGDIGGYVSGTHNLSQEGNAWIGDDAWVTDNALVSGNVTIGGNVWLSGSAWVTDGVLKGGEIAVDDGPARPRITANANVLLPSTNG